MPVKARTDGPVLPAITSVTWNGWYAGVAGGWGWGEARQTDTTPFDSGWYDTNGGLIGATLGFNWQTGILVLGVETDLSYSWIHGSAPQPAPNGNCGGAGLGRCESDINAVGTVRGRAGAVWGNYVPFVTGGFAYGHVHGEEGDKPPTAFGSGSKWVSGWTVGGGIEAMIAPRWSGKLEYLYVDFGDPEVFISKVPAPFGNTPQRLSEKASIVRIGVNYYY
jgi:outer membrane immunogenic protein